MLVSHLNQNFKQPATITSTIELQSTLLTSLMLEMRKQSKLLVEPTGKQLFFGQQHSRKKINYTLK